MRVVIDTNIMVSAYLGGVLETVIIRWRSGKFTLIVSNEIADEYHEVLNRPKFKIEREEVDDFFALLFSRAEFVEPAEGIDVIKSDSSDNKFLEAAIAGQADYIVSGDNHLLDLREFRSIPIITARKFIEKLDEANL
ncbi:MAG: putative toxin-antitoxin system toxin component, PIN family [Anaerolineales bacterium]|nr:putative toxin-antitoxin system toxin component, PIN family [Anaerolineales bacterium]